MHGLLLGQVVAVLAKSKQAGADLRCKHVLGQACVIRASSDSCPLSKAASRQKIDRRASVEPNRNVAR